jgi:hypothetical protein
VKLEHYYHGGILAYVLRQDNGDPFFALCVSDALPFEGENGVVPF